jgi:hypothetical protein
MRKLPFFVVALLVGGCSSLPKNDEPVGEKAAPPRVQRQTDQLCMSDCMGNGGQAEFCKDRCIN